MFFSPVRRSCNKWWNISRQLRWEVLSGVRRALLYCHLCASLCPHATVLAPNPLSSSASRGCGLGPGPSGLSPAPAAATLGVWDARDVWAPSLLIPVEIIAMCPHAFSSLCLPLFRPISDLGKPGLHAAGLVLADGWILVLESRTGGRCLRQKARGLGCCRLGDPWKVGLEMAAADVVGWRAGASCP